MSTASEILGRIEDDPVFRGFLEPAFDATGFASKIVSADVSRGQAARGTGVGGNSGGGEGSGSGGVASVMQGEGLAAGERVTVSAESVSSQAEITLDVSVSVT